MTPVKPGRKAADADPDDAPNTATPKRKAAGEAGSTPGETLGSASKGPMKKKGAKAAASTAVSGTIPLKNPDKIVFNRVSCDLCSNLFVYTNFHVSL